MAARGIAAKARSKWCKNEAINEDLQRIARPEDDEAGERARPKEKDYDGSKKKSRFLYTGM